MTTETKHYTMSDLHKITDRVIALIPADFEKHEEMTRDLTHFRDSLVYKSPERLWEMWQILCDKLHYYIGEPANRDWARQIQLIVCGGE